MQPLIFLLVLSLFQTSSANKDVLPVILMDSESVMSHLNIEPNPFAKMTASYFADIIHDAIKRSECVIIFVEDKLCSEDISMKDKLGSPYHRLHQGLIDKKVKYIPAVAEPYKILTQIFRPQQFNVFYLSSGVKLQLRDSAKYLYIFFQDGSNETRAQSLRKHDVIMQEVYFTVRQLKPGPIVAFYTGKVNPIAEEKLEFISIKPKDVPKDLAVMMISEGALFKFSDNVALLEGGEEVGRTEMGVGAPWNWSFICGEPLSVINTRDGSAITISQYQIQPRRRTNARTGPGEEGEPGEGGEPGAGGGADEPTKCFGKTINCGPYFNTHILSGLFITFIFMGVMTYGILMLYNCGINDRYDDPHGKEVIVNTEQH